MRLREEHHHILTLIQCLILAVSFFSGVVICDTETIAQTGAAKVHRKNHDISADAPIPEDILEVPGKSMRKKDSTAIPNGSNGLINKISGLVKKFAAQKSIWPNEKLSGHVLPDSKKTGITSDSGSGATETADTSIEDADTLKKQLPSAWQGRSGRSKQGRKPRAKPRAKFADKNDSIEIPSDTSRKFAGDGSEPSEDRSSIRKNISTHKAIKAAEKPSRLKKSGRRAGDRLSNEKLTGVKNYAPKSGVEHTHGKKSTNTDFGSKSSETSAELMKKSAPKLADDSEASGKSSNTKLSASKSMDDSEASGKSSNTKLSAPKSMDDSEASGKSSNTKLSAPKSTDDSESKDEPAQVKKNVNRADDTESNKKLDSVLKNFSVKHVGDHETNQKPTQVRKSVKPADAHESSEKSSNETKSDADPVYIRQSGTKMQSGKLTNYSRSASIKPSSGETQEEITPEANGMPSRKHLNKTVTHEKRSNASSAFISGRSGVDDNAHEVTNSQNVQSLNESFLHKKHEGQASTTGIGSGELKTPTSLVVRNASSTPLNVSVFTVVNFSTTINASDSEAGELATAEKSTRVTTTAANLTRTDANLTVRVANVSSSDRSKKIVGKGSQAEVREDTRKDSKGASKSELPDDPEPDSRDDTRSDSRDDTKGASRHGGTKSDSYEDTKESSRNDIKGLSRHADTNSGSPDDTKGDSRDEPKGSSGRADPKNSSRDESKGEPKDYHKGEAGSDSKDDRGSDSKKDPHYDYSVDAPSKIDSKVAKTLTSTTSTLTTKTPDTSTVAQKKSEQQKQPQLTQRRQPQPDDPEERGGGGGDPLPEGDYGSARQAARLQPPPLQVALAPRQERQKKGVEREAGGSGYVMAYIVLLVISAGLLYVVCHRKQRILACLIEGRRPPHGAGRRSGTRVSSGSHSSGGSGAYQRLPTEELPPAPREKPESVQNFVF